MTDETIKAALIAIAIVATGCLVASLIIVTFGR